MATTRDRLLKVADRLLWSFVVYGMVMATLSVWRPWAPTSQASAAPSAVTALATTPPTVTPVVIRGTDGTEIAAYTDQAALEWNLVTDVAKLRADFDELQRATDWDAEHFPKSVGPSVHEVADGRAPGAFGGGRKP
jgi:hypothetical protein